MDYSTINAIFNNYKSKNVSQVIHPDDVMYNTGKEHYYRVGESALRTILNGLSVSWNPSVTHILDLPCGHGRVTRHLRTAFPDAELFLCDIDQSGVAFCADTFMGKAINSHPDLTTVQIPNNLDVIWIGSLFTHLDRERTERWLNYLSNHLCKHGILVATFHGLFFRELKKHQPPGGGADWKAVLKEYRKTGFGYAPYKKLDIGDYGISLSSAACIMEIATAIPDTRVLAYTERGWANNHDVLILTRNDRLKMFGDTA